MKKLALILSMLSLSVAGFAQSKVKEADFVGNVRLLKADSTVVSLDKIATRMKVKATGSKIWWGIGSSKAFLEVPGKTSSTVLPQGEPIQLLVRVADNNQDPFTMVSIFPYTLKGGDRRAIFGKENNLFGNQTNGFEQVSFEGKKFGAHSYILELPNLRAGEYGVIVNNPTLENTSANMVIYSFTIR